MVRVTVMTRGRGECSQLSERYRGVGQSQSPPVATGGPFVGWDKAWRSPTCPVNGGTAPSLVPPYDLRSRAQYPPSEGRPGTDVCSASRVSPLIARRTAFTTPAFSSGSMLHVE